MCEAFGVLCDCRSLVLGEISNNLGKRLLGLSCKSEKDRNHDYQKNFFRCLAQIEVFPECRHTFTKSFLPQAIVTAKDCTRELQAQPREAQVALQIVVVCVNPISKEGRIAIIPPGSYVLSKDWGIINQDEVLFQRKAHGQDVQPPR